jgi:hypothetical protein
MITHPEYGDLGRLLQPGHDGSGLFIPNTIEMRVGTPFFTVIIRRTPWKFFRQTSCLG